jgi:hypothetical protein
MSQGARSNTGASFQNGLLMALMLTVLSGACGERSALLLRGKDAGETFEDPNLPDGDEGGSSGRPSASGGSRAPGKGGSSGGNGSAGAAGKPAGSSAGAAAGRSSSALSAGAAAGQPAGSSAGAAAGRSSSSASAVGGSAVGGSASAGSSSRAGSSGSASLPREAGSDARATGDAAVPGTPVVDPVTGYTTVVTGAVTMNGYATSSASAGSSIGLTCTPSTVCATGTVGASAAYSTWATASFTVNQSKSGSGSTGQLALVGSTISVSYVNKGGSSLEFQLWDGSNFWCTYLPASKVPTTATVPLTSLNSQCWNGQGTAFVSGTRITSVQLVVPGAATVATPFDYCFLGLTVQ